MHKVEHFTDIFFDKIIFLYFFSRFRKKLFLYIGITNDRKIEGVNLDEDRIDKLKNWIDVNSEWWFGFTLSNPFRRFRNVIDAGEDVKLTAVRVYTREKELCYQIPDLYVIKVKVFPIFTKKDEKYYFSSGYNNEKIWLRRSVSTNKISIKSLKRKKPKSENEGCKNFSDVLEKFGLRHLSDIFEENGWTDDRLIYFISKKDIYFFVLNF